MRNCGQSCEWSIRKTLNLCLLIYFAVAQPTDAQDCWSPDSPSLGRGKVEFRKMTEEKSTHKVCFIIFCWGIVYHTSENMTPSPRIVSASLNPSYQSLVTLTEDACLLILYSYWFLGKQSLPRLLTRWLSPIFSKLGNKLMRCLSNDIIYLPLRGGARPLRGLFSSLRDEMIIFHNSSWYLKANGQDKYFLRFTF